MTIITYKGKKYNTISEACIDNGQSNAMFYVYCRDRVNTSPSDLDEDELNSLFMEFVSRENYGRGANRVSVLYNGKSYSSITEACFDLGIQKDRLGHYCRNVMGKSLKDLDNSSITEVLNDFIDFCSSGGYNNKRGIKVKYNGVIYGSMDDACASVKDLGRAISKASVFTYARDRTGRCFSDLDFEDRSNLFSEYIEYQKSKGRYQNRKDKFTIFGKEYKSIATIIRDYGVIDDADRDCLYRCISRVIEEYIIETGKAKNEE